MKIFIASDHAGWSAKEKLKSSVGATNVPPVEWEDLGTHSDSSVDYPLFAEKLARKVLETKNKEQLHAPCGVLICGSGVGMSMAANRFPGIRAVLAMRPDVAELSRRHNASNVLCLGGRLVTSQEALEIFNAWFTSPFEGDRHERRVAQMDSLKLGVK